MNLFIARVAKARTLRRRITRMKTEKKRRRAVAAQIVGGKVTQTTLYVPNAELTGRTTGPND